ncbi:helix-turn-helix domain-containing protein [Brachybacterium sp. GCM10030268]|uniref:helix-turn-helix domain-containing protein n=1 Tax=Brachybacterium sp. GCM10030268 TaxID=3273382 RepID=UPI00360C7D2C
MTSRRLRTPQDIGAAIRDARTTQNLTQADLARATGVSRDWLIGVEQGTRPRAELTKILSVLETLDVQLTSDDGPHETTTRQITVPMPQVQMPVIPQVSTNAITQAAIDAIRQTRPDEIARIMQKNTAPALAAAMKAASPRSTESLLRAIEASRASMAASLARGPRSEAQHDDHENEADA